jgi:hypothetical protein
MRKARQRTQKPGKSAVPARRKGRKMGWETGFF